MSEGGREVPVPGCERDGAQFESGSAGAFQHDGNPYLIERIRVRGPSAGHDPVRIGIFAGVHGDEPAGIMALRSFLQAIQANPAKATGYELFAYPVVNPVGVARGTRANCSGMDLNREFWKGSNQPEIEILESELRRHRWHGLIALHADDSCEGTYGYSHGNAMEDSLLKPALIAAETVLPRDKRSSIDGFHAHEGIICDCFQGILAPPPDHNPKPFNLIFETPANAPLELQSAAHIAALDAILASYRGYISYAQDL
jgi:protein MpaA